METLQQPVFVHDAEDLESSLGIKPYRSSVLQTAVTFFVLSNRSFVQDMYDDPDDAPQSMKSKTLLLQNTLEICDNLNEQIYISMVFEPSFQRTYKGIAMEERVKEILKNEKEGVKKEVSIQDQLLKKSIDPGHKYSYTTLSRHVKNTGHDFYAFIEIVNPESEFEENLAIQEERSEDSKKSLGDSLKDFFGNMFGRLFGSKESEEEEDE